MEEEKPRVKFDSTVNLGQLLTALAMIFSVVSAYFVLKSDISNHETRLVRTEQDQLRQGIAIDKTVESLSKIQQDIAVIRDRFERSPKGEVPPR